MSQNLRIWDLRIEKETIILIMIYSLIFIEGEECII